MPGTVPGAEDGLVNGTDKTPRAALLDPRNDSPGL